MKTETTENKIDDAVIDVSHVTKMYKLYNKPSDRFREAMGLSKRKQLYKEHYALRDINISVSRGECVGIIGTNGAGKSTLLKIITGVLSPTEGSVNINGRVSALLELGAGFNQEYTGLENVYLNGTMIGFSKEEIDARLNDILSFADIGDFIHQPVKMYSSGMFVRLAFAVAINIDPEILIVDEALSVGDVFFQAKCYHKFEEFKAAGKTILFVSHDLSSISKYCDRVVLLNKGKKQAEGSPKEMVDLYKKILTGNDGPKDEGQAAEAKPEKQDTKDLKSGLVINSEAEIYGGGEAEIVDFAILDSQGLVTGNIEKETEFTVKMKVEFRTEVQDPILAFTIKDLRGTEITGTNTMFEGQYIPPQKPGDVREVTFTQTMQLQGGQYLLSLGCTGYKDGEFKVYHRMYDICELTVVSDHNTVGFFDMRSKVKLK